MSSSTHAYFGALTNDSLKSVDVIWERTVTQADSSFDVSLWASSSDVLDIAKLDAFAALLGDLDALDTRLRAGLRTYLGNDSAYIDSAKELPDSEVMERLSEDHEAPEIGVDAFVKAMQITNIGLWLGAESSPVVVDYMIDPEHSDQILAVKTTQDGEIVTIDWES